MQDGTARDTMQRMGGAVGPCWGWVAGGRDAIGDTIRLGRSGAVAQMGLRRHHDLWDVLHLAHGLCCSGRSAILCGGCAGCSWADRAGSPVGTPSATPSVWVGVHPEVCWALRAVKCFTCLREASGDSLLAFGLLLVWSEQVGDGSGSDPGGTASHLAQISLSVVIWVGHFEHHTAQRHTMHTAFARLGVQGF